MTSIPAEYLSSLFSLQGRTALCTGATRGIGANIALALAQAGADMVLVQRSTENQETANSIRALGRKVEIVVCDLADSTAVKGLIERVVGLGYELDIVVNCGGIQRRTPAEHFPDADWDEVLQVNLNTVWTISRDAGRHMLSSRRGFGESDNWQGRGKGSIINIASLVSFQGGLTVPAYTAAKHGVLGLGKALSNEWASRGVKVNSIAPGYIETEMNTALIANPTRSRQIMERIPAGRWGKPGDFGGAVVYLASRASDYVNGECLTVDGGWMGR